MVGADESTTLRSLFSLSICHSHFITFLLVLSLPLVITLILLFDYHSFFSSLSDNLFLSFSFFVTIFLCPSIYLMGKNEEKAFNFLQKSLIPPQTFSFRVYF